MTSFVLRIARTLAGLLPMSVAGCAGLVAQPPSYQANPRLLSLAPAVVFQSGEGPLSYQTAVGRDGQRYAPGHRVRGSACQRGIQVPILSVIGAALSRGDYSGAGSLSAGWGDGAFQAAVDDARSHAPRDAVLYDVQVDLHHRAYLSIYLEQCVVIDAGVLVPAAPRATPS